MSVLKNVASLELYFKYVYLFFSHPRDTLTRKQKTYIFNICFQNCNVFENRCRYIYIHTYIYIYIYTYIHIYIYIYRKSASQFSRGTVLNTLKQSRINIMRGKKGATTFPIKPVL